MVLIKNVKELKIDIGDHLNQDLKKNFFFSFEGLIHKFHSHSLKVKNQFLMIF